MRKLLLLLAVIALVAGTGASAMKELASRTVAAAQQLYGSAAANAVLTAFADRGIL